MRVDETNLELEKLYHGSSAYFEEFDMSYANLFKDFGKGFYLTSVKEQAVEWAQRSGKDRSYVYVYGYSKDDFHELNKLELLDYNEEWLKVIRRCRSEGYEPEYDVIYDRMADSNTAHIIRQLCENGISEKRALEKLKWKKRRDQYCFKTKKARNILKRLGVIIFEYSEGEWGLVYD